MAREANPFDRQSSDPAVVDALSKLQQAATTIQQWESYKSQMLEHLYGLLKIDRKELEDYLFAQKKGSTSFKVNGFDVRFSLEIGLDQTASRALLIEHPDLLKLVYKEELSPQTPKNVLSYITRDGELPAAVKAAMTIKQRGPYLSFPKKEEANAQQGS